MDLKEDRRIKTTTWRIKMNKKPEHIGKGGRTGKQDRNGAEIHDGRILKYIDTEKYQHHDEPYLVQWDNNDAGFTCESPTNFMLACVWNQMEIIGNIRDNPELMGHSQSEESDETDFRWDSDVENME